jgi:S-adenosylmethionine hydrolase
MKIERHQGEVYLLHSFTEVWNSLKQTGDADLETSVGTKFRASVYNTRNGHPVIRIFQKNKKQEYKEYARAYECCWGHYYNCNRTRIGMYVKALDNSI